MAMSKPKYKKPRKANPKIEKAKEAKAASKARSSAAKMSVEAQFAQKLASPEPKIRDRAVKKLKAWLRARQLDLTEEETLRVWKGLFYCYWMSDKPLVQEELAENVSSMVHSFESSADAATSWVSGFFVTLGREWIGIDRFRMDKFMMLVRRFVRQMFVYVERKGWEADVVRKMAGMVEADVIGVEATAALGLQLHVTDVFLEELAKVGGEDLPHETVMVWIDPFIRVLKEGKEQRMRDQVEERIFRHLMRQTDEGIAYEEEDDFETDDEEEGDEDGKESDGEMEEEDEMQRDSDEEGDALNDNDDVKDPRAGNVDITIPQLQIDVSTIAERLFEAGSSKDLRAPQRKALYRLTKQFKSLAEGKYPLTAELSDGEDDAEEEEMFNAKKIAKMQSQVEMKEIATRKEERLAYKLEMKEKRKMASQQPTVQKVDEGAHDNEAEEEGSSAEEEVQGAEGEEVHNPRKAKKFVADNKGNRKRKATVATVENDDKVAKKTKKVAEKMKSLVKETDKSLAVKEDKRGEVGSKKKKEKKKKLKVKPAEGIEGERPKAEEEKTIALEGAIKRKKKQKKTDSVEVNVRSTSPTTGKKGKRTKSDTDDFSPSKGINGYSVPTIKYATSLPTPVFVKKAMSKQQKKQTDETTPLPATPTSPTTRKKKRESGGRKINFAMTYNKYQSVLEHSRSVEASPDIPFSPARQPKQGLLKNKNDISVVDTPPTAIKRQEVARNTVKNSKSKAAVIVNRMRASDFFF